ncbi:MAG: biotin-dependent carboxyltransferase family protein [Candidatus Dormibacteraceae bacterium]
MAEIFRVMAPGRWTTIQDLGRAASRRMGVPVGGAMDRFALVAANRLVGNPDDAAALECSGPGTDLEVLSTGLVAVTGGNPAPRLNGTPIPAWTSIFVVPGDRLGFPSPAGGARAYLAVSGGLQGEIWRGSMSTFTLLGRGGFDGRPLLPGDRLDRAVDPQPGVAGRHLREARRPAYAPQPELRVVAGPHLGRLSPADRSHLVEDFWTVSPQSDRMGYRLEGRMLPIGPSAMVSFALTAGCIQLPPSGQPLLLMADHPTAGGYPVMATVCRADLPLAAQLGEGDRLRMRLVTVEQALAAWQERMTALAEIGPPRVSRRAVR